jgi:hypothetical protein
VQKPTGNRYLDTINFFGLFQCSAAVVNPSAMAFTGLQTKEMNQRDHRGLSVLKMMLVAAKTNFQLAFKRI